MFPFSRAGASDGEGSAPPPLQTSSLSLSMNEQILAYVQVRCSAAPVPSSFRVSPLYSGPSEEQRQSIAYDLLSAMPLPLQLRRSRLRHRRRLLV
jgi:hypothetical protein